MSRQPVHYRCTRNAGRLTLTGTIDIFEARDLHSAAVRAAHDIRATSVTIDLGGVDRLDLCSVQILLALRQALEASDRDFAVHAMPKRIAAELSEIGLAP